MSRPHLDLHYLLSRLNSQYNTAWTKFSYKCQLFAALRVTAKLYVSGLQINVCFFFSLFLSLNSMLFSEK